MTTGVKYDTVLTKLKEYVKKDLLFSELTPVFLKEYELYLRTKLKNGTNTIHHNFKCVRAICYAAVTDDVLPVDKNPFLKFKLRKEKTSVSFLTQEQLDMLEELPLKPGTMAYNTRNAFLFASYNGGLRCSDICKLRWLNIRHDQITLKMQKTGGDVKIAITGKGKRIIEQYRKPDSKQTDFVFPFLPPGTDLNDPLLFRKITSANAFMNKRLGQMLEKLKGKNFGLDRLSFHQSRHTWATLALKRSMPLAHIQRILGHTSVKTTEIYAEVMADDLSSSMKNLFND